MNAVIFEVQDHLAGRLYLRLLSVLVMRLFLYSPSTRSLVHIDLSCSKMF